MFLTPNQKLLDLRKKYKITQIELSGEEVSRTTLGMIETGKRRLTPNICELLCTQLQKLIEAKGITDKIDMEELLKSKETQALEYLQMITQCDTTKIKDNMWDIDEAMYIISDKDKSYFSKIFYKIFFEKEDYGNAKKFLILHLHFTPITNDLVPIISDLFFIDDHFKEYKEILIIFEFFNELIMNKENIKYRSLIQTYYATALYKCGQYNKSIETLMLYMKKAKTDEDYFLFRKKTADIYMQEGKYNNAIDEYVSLAKGKADDVKTNLYKIVLNIGIDLKDIELIKKFYNRTCDLFLTSNFEDLKDKYDVLMTLGKSSVLLNKKEEAKKYYFDAFKLGDSLSNDTDEQLFIIKELFDLLETKDLEIIEMLQSGYDKILKVKNDMHPAIAILDFYRKNMPIETEKMFKKYKQIK